MTRPLCATCLYLPGLVLPMCRVRAKENVAQIMCTPSPALALDDAAQP